MVHKKVIIYNENCYSSRDLGYYCAMKENGTIITKYNCDIQMVFWPELLAESKLNVKLSIFSDCDPVQRRA